MLKLFVLAISATGCGGGLAAQQEAKLQELNAYTAELEAELSELKEEKLRARRTVCDADSAKETESSVQASSSVHAPRPRRRGQAPDDLPIVRLSPRSSPAEADGLPSGMDEDGAIQGNSDEATLAEEEAISDGDSEARLVLQVSGKQEGRLLRRRVEPKAPAKQLPQ